jgi:hypothetical protein
VIDPRRYIAGKEEDGGLLSAVKTIGLVGAVAYGALRITNNYNQMYRYMNKTIRENKERLAARETHMAILFDEIERNISPETRIATARDLFREGAIQYRRGNI